MVSTHLRNLLRLRGAKIALLLLGLLLASSECTTAQSRKRGRKEQGGKDIHLANYDKHFIHYGILLGVHMSRFNIRYADAFASTDMNDLHSIHGGNSGGFKVGFVSNMRLTNLLDFRILPTVGFYENRLQYYYIGNKPRETQTRTYSLVEIPLLMKYKSLRRGNTRMYVVGGLNPAFEARIRGNRGEEQVDNIKTVATHWSLDFGVGLDSYKQYFKFSPELRYSFGITNILADDINDYTRPLKRIVPHNLTLFLSFEGGPSD